MALIAGYVADRPKPTAAIAELVQAFQIFPGRASGECVQRVVAVRGGHLIARHATGHPIPPRLVTDNHGNVLATLGYLFPPPGADPVVSSAAGTAGRVLEESEGEFVAVLFDASTGTVHIVNDRFSSRPFYLFRRGDEIFFSSSLAFLLTLAGERYRPDPVGWLEACTMGHTLGERTTASGVRRMGPARHVAITPERRVAELQYWRLEHAPDGSLDVSIHGANVFEAFRESAERRARLVGRGVIGLSGGLDSRLLASAIPSDLDFSAFTFIDVPGATSTPQSRAATQVAATLGLRHHVAALKPGFACPREVMALTGGMRPYQHMAIVMAYVEEMRRRQKNFLVGGGPGDSLAGAFVPSAAYADPSLMGECLADARRRRLALGARWPLIFRDDLIRRCRPTVERELDDSLAAVAGPTAAHRITAWAMVYRQPAFTFTSLLHAHPLVTEAAAHLGYRYTELMLQLPASWLCGRAFYSYMIHQALPQLRHIPYANSGVPLSGNPPPELAHESTARRTVSLIRSYGRRAAKRLAYSVQGPNGPPSLLLGHAALLDSVEEQVHSIPGLRDILDVRRCDKLLASARDGTFESDEMLGGLAAMCISSSLLGNAAVPRQSVMPVLASALPVALHSYAEVMPYVWHFWSAVA